MQTMELLKTAKARALIHQKRNNQTFPSLPRKWYWQTRPQVNCQDMSMTWNKYSLNSLCPNIDTIEKKNIFCGVHLDSGKKQEYQISGGNLGKCKEKLMWQQLDHEQYHQTISSASSFWALSLIMLCISHDFQVICICNDFQQLTIVIKLTIHKKGKWFANDFRSFSWI